MIDSTATPHTEKTRLRRGDVSPGRAFTYREVLAALQSDETRSAALATYRTSGFTADDFGTRRQAREAMLEALVAVEDAAELAARGRMTGERLAIRAVRRRLESEVST